MNITSGATPAPFMGLRQGPAQLVKVEEYPWDGDFSWLRELTCTNHPTAVYLTKHYRYRGLHLSKMPEGLDYECSCDDTDLAVVVKPGSNEEGELVRQRIDAHRKNKSCDPRTMIYRGEYGAPGYGQAYDCGWCGEAFTRLGNTFIPASEGVPELTLHDVR